MQGLVNSAALAGSLCGSLMLGRLADRIGRRAIFQYAILWYAVFTGATALAWGPWSVMALRFLAGLGLGGMLVVDPSMLAEYLPPQRRGRGLVFLDFWWPVGLLLATFLSWIFLGHNVGGSWGWRWLFLAASFPAFLAFVVRRSLPESPYFLARQGRSEEAAEVLTEITGHPVEPGAFRRRPSRSRPCASCRRAPARPDDDDRPRLDRPQRLLLRAVPLAAVRRGVRQVQHERLPAARALRGLAVPGLRGGDLARRADRAQADARVLPDPRRALRLRVRGGRLADRHVTALFFVGFFNLGAWGAVYPYTAETFPTRLRSSAFGLMEGVGKAAAIAGPYIFGHL